LQNRLASSSVEAPINNVQPSVDSDPILSRRSGLPRQRLAGHARCGLPRGADNGHGADAWPARTWPVAT